MIPQEALRSDSDISSLFDYLPMVVFYSKDREGNFLRCNRRFEELHRLPRGGARGKTDYDLHPAEMASRYRAEDQRVMESGQALTHQVWMVPDGKGVLSWWNSSKTPLRGESGKVVGVAGVMYAVSTGAGVMQPYERLEGALNLMHHQFMESLRTSELAAACHLSVSQFNRVFRKLMGQSPTVYLIRLRVDAAKAFLADSDATISEIAVRVGFYDASVFGKKFREYEGVTPKGYRKGILNGDR